MRSEIHAAVPLWINTPLEPPLPSGSPVTERWRLVQKHLPPLAELLDVEIVIMNAEGYCVGGTGPYLRGVGFRMPADNALTYSLRSGQSSMVLTPGKEEVCRTCSGKGACADVANFTGPVVIENEIVAVVQIVAFTDNQRAELLMKSEKAFELISQIIGFAWARGRDVESLPEQPRDDRFPSIIGESKAILRLKAAILKAAGTNATVLIQGESGTGKELIAQAVHDNSPRHTGPFVAINCGAIPESLMESELFGYEPGAFSGANSGGQKGLLEQAHTGTFFLDEVSEMPVSLQVKLLRVLQERVVRRVGGKVNHSVDIRIIAASNRNLRELVAQGAFREDLFFRLDVIPLFVPPLRERQGDIRLLVAHFLQSFSRERGCTYRVATELMHAFEAYPWPGNVREFENVMEFMVNMAPSGGVLHPDMLPTSVRGALPSSAPSPSAPLPPGGIIPLRDLERNAILDAVRRCGDDTPGKKAAAAALGIGVATLYRKLKEYEDEAAALSRTT